MSEKGPYGQPGFMPTGNPELPTQTCRRCNSATSSKTMRPLFKCRATDPNTIFHVDGEGWCPKWTEFRIGEF